MSKRKIAYIFGIDSTDGITEIARDDCDAELDYMVLLLIDSIKMFDPDADMYCIAPTNHPPRSRNELIKRQSDHNLTYIEDIIVRASPKKESSFIRELTCHYFSHIMDLTNDYDCLIYLDVDAIIIKPFDYEVHYPGKNTILKSTFPPIIKMWESGRTRKFVRPGTVVCVAGAGSAVRLGQAEGGQAVSH